MPASSERGVVEEGTDILDPVPQRRHLDGLGADPLREAVVDAAVALDLGQCAGGGDEDAGFGLLREAIEMLPRVEGRLADDEGASAGVADRLFELGCGGGGVDDAERGVCAVARVVDGLADGELAGADLSEDEGGLVALGVLARLPEELHEGIVLGLEVVPGHGEFPRAAHGDIGDRARSPIARAGDDGSATALSLAANGDLEAKPRSTGEAIRRRQDSRRDGDPCEMALGGPRIGPDFPFTDSAIQ